MPCAAEPQIWVYEGLITQADPSLSPDLQSRWVLSGSFRFDPLQLEEDFSSEDFRTGRLSGGISQGELTVDLYHSVHFEAIQEGSMAGFDYEVNDRDNGGRDLLGWFLPMEGQLKESGWSSRWLQVWLADPDGRMLRVAPPRIPPAGFDWKAGWFRLTFVNLSGEVAYVEGRMEVFSPESSLAREEDSWSVALGNLGRKLQERDQTILSLREELARARNRMDSLRQMVDLLMEERSHLEDESARLQKEVEALDPGTREALAEVHAEKALLEEELAVLKERNVALVESLSGSSLEQRQLLERLNALEAAAEQQALDQEAAPAPSITEVPITDREGNQIGIITYQHEPEITESLVFFPPKQVSGESPPENRAPRNISLSRRFGPRKFR